MSGPTTSASLACLLVTRRPIVSPAFGPSVTALTSAPASRSARAMSALLAGNGGRVPSNRPSIRIPSHVVQQGCGGEVVERRGEIRAGMHQ